MTTPLYPVVILAGGLATRLRPLTETIPKALVEVNNEPFIAHQLRLLRQQGVTQVIMCLGYLGEQIVASVGDGSQYGLHVSYSYDGDKLLGTAGAIKKALHLFNHEHFFVLYGDSYLPCNYRAVQTTYEQEQKLGLMTVFNNQGQWDTSNVEYEKNTIVVYDKKLRTPKMQHIDYGLEIFSRKAFEQIPDNTTCDLADLFQKLIPQNQLAAHEVTQRFYEVGSFAGITELGYYLSQNNCISTSI